MTNETTKPVPKEKDLELERMLSEIFDKVFFKESEVQMFLIEWIYGLLYGSDAVDELRHGPKQKTKSRRR